MKLTTNDSKVLNRFFSNEGDKLYIEAPNQFLKYNDELDYYCHINHNGKDHGTLICEDHNLCDHSFDTIIKFGKRLRNFGDFECKSYAYIKNNDGSIRWFFKKGTRKTEFLKLYNRNSRLQKIKSALASLFVKVVGVNVIAHGKFHVYTKGDRTAVAKNYDHNHACIFTGTRGPEQNLVISHYVGKEVYYDKIAVGENSHRNLNNEFRSWYKWKSIHFDHIVVPEAYQKNESFRVKSVKPRHAVAQKNLSQAHFAALTELYDKTSSSAVLSVSDYRKRYLRNLNKLNGLATEHKEIGMLIEQLNVLNKSIKPHTFITFSLSHGDFAPWNMYCSRDKIHLYDFELSDKAAPILSDMFHYVLSNEILLKRNGIREIERSLSTISKSEFVENLQRNSRLDFWLNLKLYLLSHCSETLLKYCEQNEDLHPQANWLIQNWIDLTEFLIYKESPIPYKDHFVQKLGFLLKDKEYVWLKSFDRELSDLEATSDIDLAITKQAANDFIKKLKQQPYTRRVHVISLGYMKTVRLFFKDASYLSIDLVFTLNRKSLRLMSLAKVINAGNPNQGGIYVTQKMYDFEYTFLFYQLNKASVPTRHSEYFRALPLGEQKSLVHYINHRYNLHLIHIEQLLEYSNDLRQKVLKHLKSNAENSLLHRLWRFSGFLMTRLKTFFRPEGLVVTVSGVDGVGKSTIIEALRQDLQARLRQTVVVRRHRPSLLPILSSFIYGKKKAEKKAATSMPRQGGNSGAVSSYFRFLYYYMDYLIGQVYVYLKYTARGKIVIYDRYYFDFINDPERSNIKINKRFAQRLYALIRKPKVNIFLYASPDQILERKQELSFADIVELNYRYLNCFDEFSNKYASSEYRSIRNDNLEHTLDEVINLCIAAV